MHKSKKQFYIFAFAIGMLFSTACNLVRSDNAFENDEKVARVKDDYLYRSELNKLGLSGLDKEDSTRVCDEYVEQWLRRKLALKYAEQNLPENIESIEGQVEEYREELYTYTYESEYIKQKLDTLITMDEFRDYYDSNLAVFKLDENIYRIRIIRLAKDAAKRDSMRILLRRDDSASIAQLKKYSISSAVSYNLDDSIWIAESVLEGLLPDNYMSYSPIYQGRKSETRDSDWLYLFNCKQKITADKNAPLSYAKPEIRKIIINKRRIELIQDLKDRIYKDGVRHNLFEKY